MGRFAGGMALIWALAFVTLWAAEPAAKKKVLIFTKSSGFQHPIIKRYTEGLSDGEKIMEELVRAAGMEPVSTKDGSLINAAHLKEYAAVIFYTSGNLGTVAKQAPDGKADTGPVVTPEGKAELLELVHSGKLAFIGIHSASDTYHTVDEKLPGKDARYVAMGERLDPYLQMLGAEFIAHDKHQPGTFLVTDPKFPGMTYGAERVTQPVGEWYSLKDFAPDLHVLMVMETAGMDGAHYRRGPYPLTWVRKHGAGRVFYTGLGHGRESWDDPAFRSMLTGAIRWATGQVEAELAPNLAAVAPQYVEIPAAPVKPAQQPAGAK